jgi:hypothetical protein
MPPRVPTAGIKSKPEYDGPFIKKTKLDTNNTMTLQVCENFILLKKQSLEVLKP